MENKVTSTQSDLAPLTPEELLGIVQQLQVRLPVVEAVEGPADARRRLAHVNAQFAEAAFNAIPDAEGSNTLLGVSDDELRQLNGDAVKWNSAIEALNVLVARAANANLHRRQKVGLAALQMYQIVRTLSRTPQYAVKLTPHVAAMRKVKPFGRGRKAPKESTPQTPETPQQ